MLYSDLIFILGFFPIITLLSVFDRSAEYKNMLLIIGSVFFISWGKPFYISALLLFSLADWIISLLIEKKCKKEITRKMLLIFDGVLNFSVLLAFTGKIVPLKNNGFMSLNMILPLCISGILLRGFMYTYEVYIKEIPAEKNYFCLLTYTSALFMVGTGYLPSYKEFEPLVRKRKIEPGLFSKGLGKMFAGMGKIVILSQSFGKISEIFSRNTSWISSLFTILFFFAWGYFLFTGLWDMSKGLGMTFGFDLRDNYSSVSLENGFGILVNDFNITWSAFAKKISCNFKGKSKSVMIFTVPLLYGIMGILYNQTVEFFVAFFLVGIVIVLEKTKLGERLLLLPGIVKVVYTSLLAIIIFSLVCMGDFSEWLDFLCLKGIGNFALSSEVKKILLNNIWLIIVGFFVSFKPLKNFVSTIVSKAENKSIGMYKFVNALKTIALGIIFVISTVLQL